MCSQDVCLGTTDGTRFRWKFAMLAKIYTATPMNRDVPRTLARAILEQAKVAEISHAPRRVFCKKAITTFVRIITSPLILH